MSGRFEKPITIRTVIKKIDKAELLLPAIQRKFVWSPDQITGLFDSILRGYPINSFMFWHVESGQIKENYKFYRILSEYIERYKTENPEYSTRGDEKFEAVIDGQQRLTSIYIGLKGSYAYKMPRKRWTYSEENFPTRKLYLHLGSELDPKNDTENRYNFRFLTDKEAKQDKYWFEVGRILDLDSVNKVIDYAADNHWKSGSFAFDTLLLLWKKFDEELINFYLENETDPDQVLKMFIRTNSGGTKLSFADLLMAMSIENWDIDARKEMTNLIQEIFNDRKFQIHQNFILKTCLVVCDIQDVKFQIKNFTRDNIILFEKNWERIKNSIRAGIDLLSHLGHNDNTIQAKNALIPIVYYIYHNHLEEKIASRNYYDKQRQNILKIQKWLNMSLLKGIFGGHSDSTLEKIRAVLKEHIGEDFPLEEIVNKFKGDPTHNYNFDDDVLDGLLKAQKGTAEATTILALLYPNMDYYNQDYHDDHLHPQARIRSGEIAKKVDPQYVEFVNDPINWNSVMNLQRLEHDANESKNDLPLSLWAEKNHKTNADLYLPPTTSLDEKDFVIFIQDRKKVLKEKLSSLIREAAF